MNDGLMDDDAFDRLAMETQRKAEELDPFLPTPAALLNQGPKWRQVSEESGLSFNDTFDRGGFEMLSGNWPQGPVSWKNPPPAMHIGLPQPGRDDSWVALSMTSTQVMLLHDNLVQAATSHQPAKGDLVNLTSYPFIGGSRFEVTVQHEGEDERRMILRWNRYDPTAVVDTRRPWWRRWLDRVWPARAER